jgi:2-polyprenyl-6-methoxyphenol hydroxylase-like FAD-dependent oxidoreductase
VQRVEGFHSPTQPAQHTSLSLDELQRVYDHRLHIPVRFLEPTWNSWFRINSRMVSRLKVGRLLFGGDAADIQLTAGAQGMNAGIQDMINLPWKLVMVWAGKPTGAARTGREGQASSACDRVQAIPRPNPRATGLGQLADGYCPVWLK